MKNLVVTICKADRPMEVAEPSVLCDGDDAVDEFLRGKFGVPENKLRFPATAWFNGAGLSRLIVDGNDGQVLKALPGAAGYCFFIDSVATFNAMNTDGNPLVTFNKSTATISA